MLSRKALCLWLSAGSALIGLAVSSAVRGQQPGADAPAEVAPAGTESTTADTDRPRVVESAATGTRSSSRSRRAATRVTTLPDEGGVIGTIGTAAASTVPSTTAPRSGGGYYYSGAAPPNRGAGGRLYSSDQYGAGSYGSSYGSSAGYTRARPRKPDPEMEKLLKADSAMEQQCQLMVVQFRKEEDQEGRAKARANLEVLTKEHFDLRQERRELEISRLEAQLQRVRAAVQKRTDVKDLIIRRRIAQLLHEEDDLAF